MSSCSPALIMCGFVTDGNPSKYSNYSNQEIYGTTEWYIRTALQQQDHTQPIVSPNLRTSPVRLSPNEDTTAVSIGLAIFRRPLLLAAGLDGCTSCTHCASKFSIVRRQS